MGGWLGGEKTSSRESGICGSALLCGFSLSEYRPLRLEVFFSSFPIRQKRILLPSGPQGWRGPIPYAKSFVFVGGLCSAAIFRTIYLTLTLGPTSMCATCADPDWCRCPSGLVCPVGAACIPVLHYCVFTGASVCMGLQEVSVFTLLPP